MIKRMIYFLILTIPLACSNQSDPISVQPERTDLSLLDSIFKVAHFNPSQKYQPLSLGYKNKPILAPGQLLSELDTMLSYRMDPNLKYQDFFNIIIDYLSIDRNLSFKHSEGSINGVFYFSADRKEKRIFSISGSWLFDITINQNSKKEAVQIIENQLFPVLKDKFKFKDGWTFINDKGEYTEHFVLNAPPEDRIWWILNYEVKMKDSSANSVF